MRLHLDPSHKGLHEFVKKLPTLFERGEGTVLHAGRNTIRQLAQEGELLAAKRFRQPGALQGILYAHIRRSKARRSFEHAVRLISLGIGTPQPVAWSEYRRKGRLTDSFYVSHYSDLKPLSEFAARFPDTASRPVLDAFARFVAELHEKGIDHRDFNQGNILCGYSPEKEQWRFELIDINRMRFLDRPLTPRQCMINLRRLSCPAPAFLYILDRYAESAAGISTTRCCAASSSAWHSVGNGPSRNASCAEKNLHPFKNRPSRLDYQNISLYLSSTKTTHVMRLHGFASYFYFFFFYGKRKSGIACA